MGKVEKLREALRGLAASDGIFLTTAQVVSIQGDTCTVRVGEGLEIDNVRLRATRKDLVDKLLFTPAVGSDVLVGSLSGDLRELAVLNADSIDKIEYRNGSLEFTIDAKTGEIAINGGTLGGMVIIGKMVEWMEKVHSDLTNLQTLLSISTVAGNGAPLGVIFNPTTPPPIVKNFENDKVKQ